MIGFAEDMLKLFRKTYEEWIRGSAQKMAAAISFYAVFSMVPLFMIALAIAGFCFGEAAARKELFDGLSSFIGTAAANSLQSMVTDAAQHPNNGALATVIAGMTLVIGASGLFIELQSALNSVWNVKRVQSWSWVDFLKTRLLSFAMVLGIGFLLLVSLIASVGIAVLSRFLGDLLSSPALILTMINFLLSLGFITLLFALIYKILPDVVSRWRAVAVGGFIAALLFNLGKFLLSLYLTQSNPATLYGAPASLVVILVWIYYSAQIMFFGAEAARAYGALFGARLKPAKGSRFMTEAKIMLKKKK